MSDRLIQRADGHLVASIRRQRRAEGRRSLAVQPTFEPKRAKPSINALSSAAAASYRAFIASATSLALRDAVGRCFNDASPRTENDQRLEGRSDHRGCSECRCGAKLGVERRSARFRRTLNQFCDLERMRDHHDMRGTSDLDRFSGLGALGHEDVQSCRNVSVERSPHEP